MHRLLVLFLLLVTVTVNAQSRREKIIIDKVEALNKAIFHDKDSLTLERLLATSVIYGHSGGNMDTRSQMIQGAISNKSVYSDQATTGITIIFHRKTAVVRHVFSAVESKEGRQSDLRIGVMQVWIKEKRQWKLMARQSVRV